MARGCPYADLGSEDRGGGVALTDLGAWAVQRMASVYLDAPVVGNLVDVPADELLRQATDMAEDAARAELDAWVAHRDVTEAVAGLVDALPGSGDVAIGLAFGALLRIGAPAAPAVRTLREDPWLGAYATVWLVDTLQIQAEDVRVAEVAGRIALLDTVLDLRGPHAVTVWLPLMLGVRSDTGRDAIAAAVGELWQDRSEAAGEVLDAIAAVHPDKPVAKATRKALIRPGSGGGSKPRKPRRSHVDHRSHGQAAVASLHARAEGPGGADGVRDAANAALTFVEHRAGLPSTIVMLNEMSHLPAELRWTGFTGTPRP